MKTNPIEAFPGNRALAGAGVSVLCVWLSFTGGITFGATTGETSATVLDFDGDGRPDLAFRRGAEIHIRSDVGREGSGWRTIALPAEIDRPGARMRGADVDGDRREEILLASPGANRIWIVAGATGTEDVKARELGLAGGPTATAVSTPVGQSYQTAWFLAFETPVPYVVSTRTGRAGVELDRWEWEMDGNEWAETLDWAAIPGVGTEPLRWARLFRAPAKPGNDSELDLTWHVQETTARRLGRVKYGNITLKKGYISLHAVGFPLATETPAVVVWGPGGQDFLTLFPPAKAGGDVRTQVMETGGHENIRWAPGKPALTGTAGTEGGRLLVIGTEGRRVHVYRATAQGDWKLETSVDAPAGESFQDALPLDAGGLVTLSGVGVGMETEDASRFRVYRNQNGKLEIAFTGDLPVATSTPARSYARVWLFDRDPFRDPKALELESLSGEDWVSAARWLGDSVEVTSATFQNIRLGLGLATVKLVRPSQSLPSGTYALGNQWEPASSLHFGSRPSAPGQATVLPTPAPGSYARGVEVTFTAPEKTTVFARIGSGPWQAGLGPHPVRQSGVVEFYGVDALGRAGSRSSVRYWIGESSPSPVSTSNVDSDADGLSDAWERQAFGNLAVRASDDTDGDGATTRDEYVSLTDPRNPNSKPPNTQDPEPIPATRIGMTVGATANLSFVGTVGVTYWVEVSEDLKAWRRSTEAIQIREGQHQWVDREAPVATRYYRVGGQR